MTDKSIRDRLVEHGEKRNELRKALKEETEVIKKLVAEAEADGMSDYEMIRLLGVSKTTVRVWLGK